MDLLMAKTKIIRDASDASVITYFRKSENCWQELSERGVKKMWEKESCSHQGKRFPCSLWGRSWWWRLSLCCPWRTVLGQIPTLQPVEDPMPEQVGMSWRKLQYMESCNTCKSRLLTGSVTHDEKHTQEEVLWQELWLRGHPWWSSLFLKACTQWKESMLEQFLKNYSLWEGPILEKFMKDYLCGRDPMPKQENSMRRRSSRDEKCYKLTPAPILHSAIPFRGRR